MKKISQHTIVFLGTAEFAVPFLAALVAHDMQPALVITQPDRPSGRTQAMAMPPVKASAKAAGLQVMQPETKQALDEVLNQAKPDLCVLVAYGELISKKALTIPPLGFVNVHPSLLPLYRGPSPVQAAILNGDEVTGVSIMLLDQKMDHGPLLAQERLAVLPTDTNETLHQRLAATGTALLVKTITGYLAGSIKPQPQDDSQATVTAIINREDGLIDWQKSAGQIERQKRAFWPWPGVYTHWDGKRLKIANLSVLEGNVGADLAPGTVFLTEKNSLAVKCGQGAVRLERVQIEGKNEVSAEEFLHGNQGIVGVALV